MSVPTLDLLMPCRNAASVFALALAHVEAFALPAGLVRQVIVLDNCSTDPGMVPILARLARHPRFTVLRHENNMGVWCSLNRGLAASGADYVMVVTSDVLIGPDTVPVLKAVLQGSPYYFVSPGWRVGLGRHPDTWADTPPDMRVQADQYNGACWAMRWDVLKSSVGWFDPQFYVACGDTDYVERLRGRGGFFVPMMLPEVVVTHLDRQSRRADNTAAQDAAMEHTDLGRFHAKWAEFPEVLRRHPLRSQEVMTAAIADGWRG